MRCSQLLLTFTLSFLVALLGWHPAEAQGPLCPSGCVGVEVTPDGASVSQSPNTGPFTVNFNIENTGSLAATYNFTCSRTGGITCGTVTPASANMTPFGERGVQVTYSVGATSGSVRLTATGPDIDQGSYDVSVLGPPVVALRNSNPNNQDRSLCLTSGAGEAGAYVCGDLVVTHSLPGYATMGRERSLTLLYNSGTARPQPVLVASITQGGGTVIPDMVLVELTVAGVVRKTVQYPGSVWGTGPLAHRQVPVSYDASSQPTGAYPFSLRVQNQYPSTVKEAPLITGTLLIVNRSTSEFGRGVWLAGVERIVLNQPSGQTSLLWVGGDGSAKLYTPTTPTAPTVWIAPMGAFRDTIKLATGEYTRTLRHNVKVTFDGQGRHTKTTNKAGHVTTFTWTSGKLTAIGVPPAGVAGTTYSLVYAAGGALDYILDPKNRKLDATINAGGLLQTVVDPDLRSTSFGYNAAPGLLTSRTNRQGHATQYAYANGRRLTSFVVPVGRTAGDGATSVVSFVSWDEKGLQTPPDTALGYTTIYGPRYRPTPPLVSDTAAIWVNGYGAPTKIINPLGFRTLIERENAGLPALVTGVIYPNNRIVLMEYDGRGNLTQVRDSTWHLGMAVRLPTKATTYHYPTSGLARDMPLKVVDSTATASQPIVTNYAYNAAGLTQQVTAPNTHVTKFAYTSLNLVDSVTEVAVPIWNQATQSEASGDMIRTFGFNTLGNVTADTSPLGRVTRYTRDTYQRVSHIHDPASHQVQYAYDLLNRIQDVTEHVSPAQLVTHSTYDIDNVTAVSDPRGVTREWQYDKAGRVIAETDEANHTELRFYNNGHLLDSVRQRVFEGPTGKVIRYKYDAAGQRTVMAWPARPYTNPTFAIPADSITYAYDNMGRMTSAASVDALLWDPKKIIRTYYARGELKSETTSRLDGTGAFTHRYFYDRLGRRLGYAIGTPGDPIYSDSITYTYKPNGELNSIRMRWRGASVSADSAVFKWDALGRRDSVAYSNKAFIKFAYDRDGALRLTCGNDTVTTTAYADVHKFTYNNAAVDGEGLVTSSATIMTNANLKCGSNTTLLYTQANGYDGRHQLQTMSRNTGEGHTYTFDNSGNMTRDNQTPPVQTDHDFVVLAGRNQLERSVPSVGSVTRYLYDANGARTFECPGLSGCAVTPPYRKYYYDGLGRMVGTDEFVTDADAQVNFPDYDPLGRMMQAPDAPARFGFDGDNVVRTNFDETANSWTFVHGPGVDDPLIGHFTTIGSGQVQVDTTVYFVTDGQGRQYGVGNGKGQDMTTNLSFKSWGGKYAGGTLNAASFSADRSSPASMKQLSFFRNRFYDQATGRWTQEDPIGVAGGLNLYQFNGNNPVSYSDPFGLCPIAKTGVPCTLTKAGTGLVAGAVSGAVFGASGGTMVLPGGATVAGAVGGGIAGGTAGLVAGAIVGAVEDAVSIGGMVIQHSERGAGRLKEWIASIFIALGGGNTRVEPEPPPPVVAEDKRKKREKDDESAPPESGE